MIKPSLKNEPDTRKKKNFIYFYDRHVLDYISSPQGQNNLLPSISIGISSECNFKCPHCIYDAGKNYGEGLSINDKLSLLENAHSFGARYLQICHDGEPFSKNNVSSTLSLLKKAKELNIKSFIYTNASEITKKIAKELYEYEVCLAIHCDSMNSQIFNNMIGIKKANNVYRGINYLLSAGYDTPFTENGRIYTRMGLVCTLTRLNATNIENIKEVAIFCWRNRIFFGAARLEKGGRASGIIWKEFKLEDKLKITKFINWCSEQTGINYWNAQPKPYCIGVCGLQIRDNGDVWITNYGGSCDFTEPDGENYPKEFITLGNVGNESLENILKKIWIYRKNIYEKGILHEKLEDYVKTKAKFPNGLQDCGSGRTYTLFKPFFIYVRNIINKHPYIKTQLS